MLLTSPAIIIFVALFLSAEGYYSAGIEEDISFLLLTSRGYYYICGYEEIDDLEASYGGGAVNYGLLMGNYEEISCS